MEVNISGFSNEDADYYYIDTVRAHVLSKDGSPKISIFKKPEQIVAHIVPSNQDNRQPIIDELLSLHRSMGMKIIFSKSLGISQTVSFVIQL